MIEYCMKVCLIVPCYKYPMCSENMSLSGGEKKKVHHFQYIFEKKNTQILMIYVRVQGMTSCLASHLTLCDNIMPDKTLVWAMHK